MDRITLMVPIELKTKLEATVEPGVRTFSDAVRECIRRGLEGSTSSQSDDLGAPWARAVGEAAALVADSVETVCPSNDAKQRLGIVRAATWKLFTALGARQPAKDDQQLAEALAEAVAQSVLKVRQAEAPSSNYIADVFDGSAPRRRRAAQLLKIQKELGSGRE